MFVSVLFALRVCAFSFSFSFSFRSPWVVGLASSFRLLSKITAAVSLHAYTVQLRAAPALHVRSWGARALDGTVSLVHDWMCGYVHADGSGVGIHITTIAGSLSVYPASCFLMIPCARSGVTLHHTNKYCINTTYTYTPQNSLTGQRFSGSKASRVCIIVSSKRTALLDGSGVQ